jgi:hypothetical protein
MLLEGNNKKSNMVAQRNKNLSFLPVGEVVCDPGHGSTEHLRKELPVYTEAVLQIRTGFNADPYPSQTLPSQKVWF